MKTDAQKVQDTIEAAVSTTFSTMVFAEVFPSDPDLSYFSMQGAGKGPADNGGYGITSASLDIIQPLSLTLQLTLRNDLAVRVTENLLGWAEDDAPPPDRIQDAVGELLNTIAGMMAQHLTPEGETFDIGLPRISAAPPPAEDEKTVVSYFLQDDTYLFAVAVWGEAL